MSIRKYTCLTFMLLVVFIIESTESVSVQRKRNSGTDSKVQMESSSQDLVSPLFRGRRTYIDENENCGPHDLEMVHTIMDRICMLCHELRSHFAPNTRVECRKDCFQNTAFQSCMKIFSGVPSKTARHNVEPTAPIPLYTEEVQTLDDIEERRRRI